MITLFRFSRRSNPLVFISYRDCDEPWAAMVLERELSWCLGDEAVFLDSQSVSPGMSFDESLLSAVRHCVVLLVVIGNRWYAMNEEGKRLLDHRHDWVRREIVAAFSAGTTVIPVLVGDVPRLRPEQLPASIRRLARCQAVRLRYRDCRQDLARLVTALSRLSGWFRDFT